MGCFAGSPRLLFKLVLIKVCVLLQVLGWVLLGVFGTMWAIWFIGQKGELRAMPRRGASRV